MENSTTDTKDDSVMKNIVIIGAGYGGLTASASLGKIIKKTSIL